MNKPDIEQRPSPEQVARAFLRPRPPTEPRSPLPEGGESLHITTPEGEVALQRTGTGPVVLLLHGWEGHVSDLAAFVPPLLAAGLSVVAMHLPAHGESPGRQTSIPQSARALLAVGESIGPFAGVIAHSIGSAVLVEALNAGLVAQRVVMISAPARYERYARGAAAAAGLDAEGTEEFLAVLSHTMQADIREVSLPQRAPLRHEPALFVHSSDDRVVSIEDSLASAAAWPGARHQRVEGLGHRRILGDASVVAPVVAFVAAGV
ncbi:MAG: hypothetical protein RLZZ618_2392 [Pseudomonadota bacterium]